MTDVAKPGAPTSLTATADGPTKIRLSWTASTDDGGADISYLIQVSTDGGSTFKHLVASTPTTYPHTGLSAGTTRHYRVNAFNLGGGAGPYSNIANTTTAPNAPTALKATADGPTKINLSWIAPSNNGGAPITGHQIQVSTNGGTSFTNLVANTGSMTTSYSHTGLRAGTTRHYQVRAINSAGPGAVSNTANATTGGTTLPSAPKSLKAAPRANQD